jgi:hypothetical protein
MAPADSDSIPFWFSDNQPGAGVEALDRAERRFGIRLPTSLRELLREKDGGVSNFSGFKDGSRFYSMLPILSVDPAHSGENLFTADAVRAEYEVPKGVITFAAQGESWWGLDYRTNSTNPSIVFRLDFEHGIETVAGSFEEFLKGLVE